MKKLLMLLLCGTIFGLNNNQVFTTNGSAQRVWQGPLPVANGGTGYASVQTPTVQSFLQTVYYTFTISTSTPSWAAGDTYTTNGGADTWTTVYAKSVSGATTFVAYRSAGSSAPTAPTSTLTRTAGSGTSSLTYTAAAANGTYYAPSGVTWIRVRAVGGGMGGGSGGAGGNTTFGSSFLAANGGTAGGTPGTASIGAGASGLAVSGGCGAPYQNAITGFAILGGSGGNSALGGGGQGGNPGLSGIVGAANTGGGGGGNGAAAANQSNSGGSSGGFLDAVITSVSSTYIFNVGAGGTAGAGAAGGTGGIWVEEHYGF